MVANLDAVKPEPKARPKPRKGHISMAAVKEVGELIAYGLTEDQACRVAKVNHHSLRTIRRRTPAVEAAIKGAQAQFVALAVRDIRQGVRGWQGAAWLLERRHGDQFRLPRESHAVTVTQQTLGVTISAEALADIRRIAKEQAIHGLPVTSKPTITTGER